LVACSVGFETLEPSPRNHTPSNSPDAVVRQEQLVHHWAPESRVRRYSVSTLSQVSNTRLNNAVSRFTLPSHVSRNSASPVTRPFREVMGISRFPMIRFLTSRIRLFRVRRTRPHLIPSLTATSNLSTMSTLRSPSPSLLRSPLILLKQPLIS
jgi:hypothetical protein